MKNAECLNSEGSYNCQCKLGFIGDGYSYCAGNELLLSNEIKFLATRHCGESVRAAVTTVANYCIGTSLIFQLHKVVNPCRCTFSSLFDHRYQ